MTSFSAKAGIYLLVKATTEPIKDRIISVELDILVAAT